MKDKPQCKEFFVIEWQDHFCAFIFLPCLTGPGDCGTNPASHLANLVQLLSATPFSSCIAFSAAYRKLPLSCAKSNGPYHTAECVKGSHWSMKSPLFKRRLDYTLMNRSMIVALHVLDSVAVPNRDVQEPSFT